MEEVLDGVYRIDVPRPGQSGWKVATDEPVSCHVLVGDETVLFGTGHGASVDVVLEGLDRLGGVDVVVVEHGDPDHYGGLPSILERYDGVTVAMPAEDAAVLPKVYRRVRADFELTHDQAIAGVRAISVPGHTAGNMAFLDEDRDLLVVGDTVVHADSDIAAPGDWSGAFAPIDPVFSMRDDLARSNLVVLADYAFDAALVTHGPDVLEGAWAAYMALLDDLGLMPDDPPSR